MYGFTPGYAYMGGLSPESACRAATPVQDVPAGSVIIAGPQCIVTTFTMPTGWWIIGRSPARLFLPEQEEPVLFGIGDEVSFVRVGADALEKAPWLMRCSACCGQGRSTSLQDLGRPGYARYGVTEGGAMDRTSHRIAQALAGNPPEAAGTRDRHAGTVPALRVGRRELRFHRRRFRTDTRW